MPWRQQSYWLILVAILFITLSAAAPLWGPGIINTRGGGDSPFLIQRTLEMAENIKHVVFPPRWMSHAAYGYGYPFFNHYGALPYYISGSLSLLGMPVTLAIQGTQTLGFVLAGFAMALWASQIYKNKWSIILSSAAYTYAPFHMVNIYIRGDSLSEFYAFIWFPLILWALHRYAKVPSWSRMCIIACTYGGLILTHNTSAVTFSPFALLYAIALTLKTKGAPKNRQPIIIFKQYLIPIIVPFLLGVLLTMWFWLPAIAEIKFGQLGPDFTEGYFHHSQHYRGLNLVQNSVAFDYSIALKAEDAGPFSMGLVQAILAGCGVLFFWFSHKRRHMVWVNLYLLSSLALTTVIMTPLSAFLWDNISLLSVTQFPWRFLSIQAVFTAAITANIPNSIRKKKEEVRHFTKQQLIVRTLLSASAIILLAGAALVNLHPDRLAINNDDVSWDNLLLYEIFTGNIGTTIRHEYLPKNVVPRPYITQAILDQDIGPKIDGDGDMIAHLLERGPAEQSWHIQLKSTASQPHELITVAFPLYWWPGWQAKVNGTSIPTYALPGSGELALDVPEGAHDIVLRLHGTKLQKLAMGVSCITAILVIVSVTIERCFSLAPKKRLGYDRVLVILLLVTTSLLLPVMWNSPYENNGRYYDFEQMPYPHAGPVDFKLATLDQSVISTDTARPGEQISINMQWSLTTTQPLTATLRLVSPAEHRHNVSYPLLKTEITITPNVKKVIQLPDNISRGLYLIQLRVYAFPLELMAKTPQGRDMGPLFIGAIRIPEGPSFNSLTADDPIALFKDINLHEFDAYQTQPDILRIKMVWTTPGTPRNWSLSLRLLDIAGQQITQRDTQPGYGYMPTGLWHSDEKITDYLEIILPEGLAPGDYQIRLITYLQATMETGGEVDIPVRINEPTLYDLRNACCEQVRKGATIQCQIGGIALLSVDGPDVITSGEDLFFTVEWNAVQPSTSEVTAQWAVVSGDNVVANAEAQPLAPGSETTSWPLNTWVLSPMQLDLDPLLPAGTYHLQLTMDDGLSTPQTCRLKDIIVQQRPRVYTVPSLPYSQAAIFNNEIMLLGYEVKMKRTQQRLDLILWWKVEKTPQVDYKRFVHLYDPKVNSVIVQDDAMPRAWTYPTTLWVEGEVISETVDLPLNDIPRGNYNLGVGWYNPETLDRLPAHNDDPTVLKDNRITLSFPVKIP